MVRRGNLHAFQITCIFMIPPAKLFKKIICTSVLDTEIGKCSYGAPIEKS